MKEKIEALKQERETLKSELKTYVKDSGIPLEERWNSFIDSKLGDTDWRTDFGLDRDDEFLYEGPMYMEKYETRDVEDILEALKSDEDFGLTPEEEITFKEYCLNGFYAKMKFDW